MLRHCPSNRIANELSPVGYYNIGLHYKFRQIQKFSKVGKYIVTIGDNSYEKCNLRVSDKRSVQLKSAESVELLICKFVIFSV